MLRITDASARDSALEPFGPHTPSSQVPEGACSETGGHTNKCTPSSCCLRSLPNLTRRRFLMERIPPVNCRRSCTDFGLRRCDSFKDQSPLADRLQHTPTDSDSGSDRSFYGRLTSDFPAPPPIGSPVIRRMRSSPWMFNNPAIAGVWLGTDADHWDMTSSIPSSPMATTSACAPGIARQPCPQYSAPPLAPSNSLGRDVHSSSPVGQRELRRQTKLGIDMDRAENMNTLFVGPWFGEVDGGDLVSLPTDDIATHKREGLSHSRQGASPLSDDVPHSTKQTVGKTFNNREASHSGIRLPRIIRKVTSMNLAAKGVLFDNGACRGTVQPPMPRCRSFLSISCAAESKRLFQEGRCSDAAKPRSQPQDLLFALSPYSTALIPGGHQLAQALIEPTAKPATYDRVLPQRSSESLRTRANVDPWNFPEGGSVSGSSFQLGPSCSNTDHQRILGHPNSRVSYSFIDFTPERTESNMGNKKERMKTFIAKTSGGIIGWGKNLLNKKRAS